MRLQPGRNIDPVSVNIVFLNDHIITVNPDAPDQFTIRIGCTDAFIAFMDSILKTDRAVDGFHWAGKFGQNRIPRGVKNTATMLADESIDNFAAGIQAEEGFFLISKHMLTETHTIGGKNGYELAVNFRQDLSTSQLIMVTTNSGHK